ncbi:MAG: hypothetical protein ACK6BM_06385 [Cyanobacteriota bacterium]
MALNPNGGMAEGTPSPYLSERQNTDDAPRGERSSAPREGGFRIRLSDNEMRSARALQEAFGLRSTVAVLGFALRTLGQQLEEGKLEELVSQHRAQVGAKGASGGRPEGRRERPEGRGSGGRWQENSGKGGRGGAKVDPFARPSRPAAAPDLDHEQPVEAVVSEPETTPLAVEPPAPEEVPADTSAPVAAAAETEIPAVVSEAPAEGPEE